MSTGTLNSPLGHVTCKHRWETGPELPWPRMPTASPTADKTDAKLGVETGICRRCGCARLRFYDLESDYAVSRWSVTRDFTEIMLGRLLDEHDRERMLTGMVLN